MSSTKKTILICPMNQWGHINACLGIAQELLSRGHRVVWAIDRSFEGKLSCFGFEEVLIGKVEDSNDDKLYWQKFMVEKCKYLKKDPLTIFREFNEPSIKIFISDTIDLESQYKELLDKVKPNLIVIDMFAASVSLTLSGIPFVLIFSAAPHYAFINENKIPPPWSGLPKEGKEEESKEFRKQLIELITPYTKQVNEYYVKSGGQPIPNGHIHPFSPDLNIYLYPKELDYEELHPLPNNWTRVENILRIVSEKFEIPEKLKDKPGKLVFLSMGSFGCANLELMTKLTGILAKSKNKFIVSKGPVFEPYELPDNMWGQRFLPQTSILPLVDLVITHGGNNSTTESFYFGKPVLILPLFGDQLDNAQRVKETGLGLGLNPFHCTEEQLLNAVDTLVNDQALAQRMERIGKRIRASEDKKIVSDKIEQIAK